MKNLFALFLAMLVWACSSSGNKETIVQDSTSLNDTLDVPAMAYEEPAVTEDPDSHRESDTSQLEITFDETAGLVFERMEPYYTVTVVTKQYEASADVTWYFDNDISPIYFKQSWSAEGNEGSTEFFIKQDNVVCAQESESNYTLKWCNLTGGTKTTWDEGEDSSGSTVELLDVSYEKDCNESLKRYLDILKQILNEGELTEQDGNYVVRIETIVNYGREFTESTEVLIPKKVYEGVK